MQKSKLKLLSVLSLVGFMSNVALQVYAITWYNPSDTAPNPITTFSVSAWNPSSTKANLSWTAVWNSLNVWTAARYVIKMSTGSINASNFDSATTVGNGLTPKEAGNAETFTVINLTAGTTYYFAIKAVNTAGLPWDLSNVVSITTTNSVPTVTSFSPTSAQNDAAATLTVNWTNFVNGANKVRLTNSSSTINIDATYVSDTQVTCTVATWTPAGEYNVKVINSNWTSANASSTLTITQAPTAIPTVTNVVPTIWTNDVAKTVTVYWTNFVWVTSVVLDDGANTALTSVSVVSTTKITATIPAWVVAWTYNIKVTTSNWTNYISAAKYTAEAPVVISSSSSSNVTTDKPISLSGTNTVPVDVSLETDTDSDVYISAEIAANTTITTSDGSAYTGTIIPPRVIAPTSEMQDLGTDAVVIQMWSAEQWLVFSTWVVVTVNIQSDSQPVIWYYNQSTDTYELAWTSWTKDGVSYVPWGTVISRSWNTWTMWLLITHMSVYVNGVNPTISSVSPSSATAGASVSIAWANFHPSAVVTVWWNSVTYTVNNTSSITLTVPSIAVGTYTISVKNPDNRTATLTNWLTITTSTSSSSSSASISWWGGGWFSPSTSYTSSTEEETSQEEQNNVEEQINTVKEQSTTKSYTISGKKVDIIIPPFKSSNVQKTVGLVNDKIVAILKTKNLTETELDDAVYNYNSFLAALQLYRDNKDKAAKTLAKKYLKALIAIVDKPSTGSKSTTTVSTSDTQETTTPEVSADMPAAVAYLNSVGITKYSDVSSFRPNDSITRQEAAKFYVEYAKAILKKVPDTSKKCNFTDESDMDSSLQSYVVESCQLGIFKGYPDGSFKPTSNILKWQAIALVLRPSIWTMEENVSPWYLNYYLKAMELWLTNEQLIAMEWAATRWEIALMIYNYSKSLWL